MGYSGASTMENVSRPVVIFLAGTPSTGKSEFGEWAAQKHEIAHIDAEQAVWAPSVESLHSFWGISPDQVRHFMEHLLRDGRPFIFNWGFPPEFLDTVRAVRDAGAELWWFNGARGAARTKHQQAGKSLSDFDVQTGKIDAHWPAISTLFPPERVLPVLREDGTFLAQESIYQRLLGRSG